MLSCFFILAAGLAFNIKFPLTLLFTSVSEVLCIVSLRCSSWRLYHSFPTPFLFSKLLHNELDTYCKSENLTHLSHFV